MSSDSDVDFHDVFGGPPRRSSIHEAARYSFNEFKDSYSLRGKEKSTVYRSSWSGLSEKPVFGDEILNRRRHTTDDFFNDIFRGGESPSLTPRKSDRDPCSSSPGSRVLSPVRPLPPRAEPFGSQSLPAQFSLPAKLTKGMDLMPFASVTHNPYGNKDVTVNVISSPNSPTTSMSRFSNQTIQGQDELRNDVRSSYRQSPLSHEFSLSRVGSVKETKFDKAEVGGNLKRDSNSSDVTSNSTQFHFSIYKWASKGVPLTMPLRGGSSPKLKEKTMEICSSSKGKVEDESMVSESLAETLSDVEFPSLDDSASTNTLSYRMERKKQGNESLLNKTTREKIESCQTVEDTVIAIPQSEPLVNLQNIVGDVTGKIILHDTREEKKHNALPDVGLRGKTKEEFHLLTREACKPELESLPSLIYDNNNEQGENVMKQEGSGREESMVKTTKKSSGNINNIGRSGKTQDGERSNPNGADMDKDSVQHSPLKSGVNIGRNKVKGKVKEFVKMFNQEAPLKPINNVDTQSLSCKWKARATCRAENEVSVGRDSKDEKLNIPNVKKKKKTLSNSSVKGDEYLKQLERQNSVIDTTALIFSDNSPGQTDSLLRSSVRASNATLGNLDDSFQGSFLVKELSQEQSKLPQTGEDHEDLQVSDAKIRKWSNGKEGNIRSLLSTLQYILWAESGWKPVPLVDIIEGNAVKKAYQKALLCLHPDKLQQKGVAAHEKYIAEKVFDILQDAWTHFNSLASL